MEVPEVFKKTPVLVGGGVVLLIVVIVLAKRSHSASATINAQDTSGNDTATMQANVQIAQINADIQKAQIQAGSETTLGSYARDVSLANIQAETQVAGAKIASDLQVTTQKIASDENVSMQNLDYAHDISNRQLENNRILGLTAEDTKRLISTQETTAAQNVAISQIDLNRYLGELAIRSDEAQAMRSADLEQSRIESQERVQDFTTSRALTYGQIQGANQVNAIRANKPSTLQTIFGGLGDVAKIVSTVFNPASALIPTHSTSPSHGGP